MLITIDIDDDIKEQLTLQFGSLEIAVDEMARALFVKDEELMLLKDHISFKELFSNRLLGYEQRIEELKEYAQHTVCERYNNLSDKYYDEIGKACTCGLINLLKKEINK